MTPRSHTPAREGITVRRSIYVLTPDDLYALLRPLLTSAAVIVCIGSELHGDDAAGVIIGRELTDQVPWPILKAGLAPESFVVKIANYRPDTVILIDAVDFGGRAGEVILVDVDRIVGVAAGTHGPSLMPFVEALQLMHRCDLVVLGIQPLETRVGDDLSPPVRQAVSRVVGAIHALADDDGS
ncbi:hypothetical protein LCGC14_0162190 [marine sediment metagenome]|uniref:Hydrogenase maturation protease n=1 Tax=marine sediment metagenome TaxID=412755 RepID=A0A0F9UYZ9_9ZZZZ